MKDAEPKLVPLLKTPSLIHHLKDMTILYSQVWQVVVEVVEVGEARVLKVVEVEWAMPYEMELEYSFCSSGATPAKYVRTVHKEHTCEYQ